MILNSRYLILFLSVLIVSFIQAQDKNYKIASIGFYNVENLFDTTDSEETNDTEFTPKGSKNWTNDKYNEKLGNLARVIRELGTENNRDGLSILGLSEVENRAVIEDLIDHPELRDRNYQIIHEDSPDRRGIDVALIYRTKLFEPTNYKYHPLIVYREDKRVFTRDILQVSGKLDGEMIHVFVNHWPSRSGGEKRSRYLRNAAAKRCSEIADSIRNIESGAKIIIMGDLNDDPNSPSLKNVLKARASAARTPAGGFYNPMWAYYKKGIGSNAYRDAWSLFDQIVISQSLLDKDQEGFFYYKTQIHNKDYLVQNFGQYKGYPFRTFSGDTYIAGYSDHFPVYIYLLKEVD